jgi:GT2 family glycosyltransferase
VLAVDNGSTDGSAEMVRHEFPDVRLVALPDNLGAAARNTGVAAASGDIVLTLDNDVRLTSPDDVERTVQAFARHPRAAVVNFMILGPDGRLSHRDWCHPRDAATWAGCEFPTAYVLEGASACRRAAFLEAGGYWPPFFIGHEGLDLALRLLDRGWDLIYTPMVRVRHLVDATVRPAGRIYYTFTRNAVWVALRNHRPAAALGALAQDLGLMAFCALRAGHGRAFVQGLRDGLRGAPAALAARRPLSPATYQRLRDLHARRPGLARRALRHLRERLI